MSTNNRVVALLEQVPGVSDIDPTTDRVNWITKDVVRCVYEGKRAVAVDSDTKTQINALLDLVDLHLNRGTSLGEARVAADELVLFLVSDDADSEPEGALRTLAAEVDGLKISLVRLTSDAELLPIAAGGLDDLHDHEKYRYTDWLPDLMGCGERPPALVERILAGVPREEFRAYPAGRNRWSLRLEGLEVGEVGPRKGHLAIGKDDGNDPGLERKVWLTTVPEGRQEITDDDASIAEAVASINRFADAWTEQLAGADKHKEHSLESRILRGIVPIRIGDRGLDLLRTEGAPRVSWGSQFPTRWGQRLAPRGRFLDALLRDGSTPWALEIKIDGNSGVASYYRHAVSQAVLYREFIRRATHLAPWFERFGLDHTACRAAVVVPEFRAEHTIWKDRLTRVCAVFDVELVTVPRETARAGGIGS
jgi:hypothetical protein